MIRDIKHQAAKNIKIGAGFPKISERIGNKIDTKAALLQLAKVATETKEGLTI